MGRNIVGAHSVAAHLCATLVFQNQHLRPQRGAPTEGHPYKFPRRLRAPCPRIPASGIPPVRVDRGSGG